MYKKDLQYYKFCLYGFLKNLRFFEPYFILFLLSTGLNFTQIGALYATREIVTNLLEIPSGLFADSLGRKKSLLLAYILYIISYIIFAVGQNFLLFIMAMSFYGAADSFRSGTHKSMIYKYLEVKRWSQFKVDYYGHTRSCSQLGSALSSLIAAALLFVINNYSSVFYFTIIPYILGFLLISSYPNWLDKGGKKHKNLSFQQVWRDFIDVLKRIEIFKILANLSLLEAYHKSLKDYIQPIIKQLALGVTLVYLTKFSDKQRVTIALGVIYFVIYLLTAYASRRSVKLLKYYKSQSAALNLLLILTLILGLLSGAFYYLKMYVLAIIAFLSIFVVHNLRKPIAVAFLNKHFKTAIFTSAISTQNQIKSLFTAFLSLLLGFLTDKMGIGLGIITTSFILLAFSMFVKIQE